MKVQYIKQIGQTANIHVPAHNLSSGSHSMWPGKSDSHATQLKSENSIYVANEEPFTIQDHNLGVVLNAFGQPVLASVPISHDSLASPGTASILYIHDNKLKPWSSSATDAFVLTSEPKPVSEIPYGHAEFAIESDIPQHLIEELEEFEKGIEGIKPTISVVQSAHRIVAVANEFVPDPDVTVDIDGELSFYLTLSDGRLVMAELAIGGSIDASVYDPQDRLLDRFPATTADAFVSILKS